MIFRCECSRTDNVLYTSLFGPDESWIGQLWALSTTDNPRFHDT
jgi:hypothetical protein